MSFYPVMPPNVPPAGGEDAAPGGLARAGMVAVRAADLASPCGRGLGKDGRTALAAAGAGRIRAGDLVVWLKPVAVTRAVVRRDGRVQAAGHPADHARLGVAEQRLDELTGRPGVIDEIARAVMLAGTVKGAARRAMSPALAIRFTLLMTLVPDADYPEVMDILPGDLVLVPWQRPYQVPTAAAACTWREAIGLAPLERLQGLLLDGIDDEHRGRDYRAVMVGALDISSIDGSLIRVPDGAANRTASGSAGTADDSSPYPQVRELRLSNASTRATFAVTTGPSGAGAGRAGPPHRRGSQYTSIAFTGRLAAAGAQPSVGTVGDAYDNALAETVIGLYKTELIRPHGPWRTCEQVEIATLRYVDWFNHQRLFEACGDIPPAELEAAYYRQNTSLTEAG